MLKNPAIAAEYEALEPEFEFKREFIRRVLEAAQKKPNCKFTNKSDFLKELLGDTPHK